MSMSECCRALDIASTSIAAALHFTPNSWDSPCPAQPRRLRGPPRSSLACVDSLREHFIELIRDRVRFERRHTSAIADVDTAPDSKGSRRRDIRCKQITEEHG